MIFARLLGGRPNRSTIRPTSAKIAERQIMMNEKLGQIDGAPGEEMATAKEELQKQFANEKRKIEESTEKKVEIIWEEG